MSCPVVQRCNLRQLMYAMRPDILRLTGRDGFSDDHVTQVCIPEFADPSWKIAADARGAMMEPHTQRRVGVGTVEVVGYTAGAAPIRFQRPVSMNMLLGDLMPSERIRRLLYIEKEGFSELIESSGLLERFDMATISTKGMSVIAARQLIDYLAGQNPDFEVYALVDFDITGVDILRTLTADTERFTFDNHINLKQLGVTWEQAQMLHGRGLSEPVDVKGDKWEIRRRMAAAGLDGDAAEFLAGYESRRVELNAFTSQELLDIIEEGVNGDKLIPDDRRLGEARAEMMVRAKVAAYEAEVRKQPPTPPLENLRQHVTAMTSSRPELSWDEAVGICAQQVLEEGVSNG